MDTAFVLALLDRNDEYQQGKDLFPALASHRSSWTTEAIIEIGNSSSHTPIHRQNAYAFIKHCQAAIEIINSKRVSTEPRPCVDL